MKMKQGVASSYHARMQRVLVYIDEHLDDDLRVDVLCDVAAFSKHHFHRQFSALFGVGVYRYVQLLRLKRASFRLAFRVDESVLQIALDSGYEGPEAFARAFKQRLGQTPRSFRSSPEWTPWHTAYEPLTQARSLQMQAPITDDDVRIQDFPETPVAIMEHRGDPAHVGETIRRFISWRTVHGLSPARSATFNLLHDDPETTPPGEYRMSLCAAARGRIDDNDQGVTAGVIPAGRCAVMRLMGSSDCLRAAALYLYADWLPRSGYDLRDFPIFAQRVAFFPDVPEHEAITDVFLPLK
jgi:AraC family transcriptional regulator